MSHKSPLPYSGEHGFTLVEIMVVLVIVGILAAVAIPKYMAIVTEASTGEAKVILSQIIMLEVSHFYATQGYITFDNVDVPQMHFVLPVNSKFDFRFDDTGDGAGLATATENVDINRDGDSTDGLTLDTSNHTGAIDDGTGSQLHW